MSVWRRFVTETHRRSLWQVLSIYVVGSWVGYQVVLDLVQGIGLPSWLPGFAAALFVIGLPIVLATAFVQKGLPGSDARVDATGEALDPALFPGTAAVPEPAPARKSTGRVAALLTWRRALAAGAAAFLLLGVVTAAWLLMRAAGIGPMASLLAAEEVSANDRVLVAEFEPRGADSALAAVVTDAFRIDFARSTVMRAVTPAEVQSVLRRMGVSDRPYIDDEMAHQIAMRDGIPVYITGDVSGAGAGFVLSAQLIATASGEVLVALREKARTEDDVIDAVDRLSRSLRERTGESLKTIRRAEPLAKVTTASLEALQYYTQGARASSWEGNPRRSMELHQEAIRHDSTFAAAHRAIAVLMLNNGDPDAAIESMERALRYDDRQTEIERAASAGTYHMARTEYGQAVAALERAVAIDSTNFAALNNLGLAHTGLRDMPRAVEYYRKSIAADTGRFFAYANLGEALTARGQFAEAEQAFRDAARRAPTSPWPVVAVAHLPYVAGDIAEAEARLRRIVEDTASPRNIQQRAADRLRMNLQVQGRYAEIEQRERARLATANPNPGAQVWALMDRIAADMFVFDRPEAARRALPDLKRALVDRDGPEMLLNGAILCGWMDDVECARDLLARSGSTLKAWTPPIARFAHAGVARAQGDLRGAVQILRDARNANCHGCALPLIGMLFVEMEQPDSAAATYETYIATPSMDRIEGDFLLAPMHEWLGYHYAQRGDRAAATRHFSRFIEIWKKADPPLQGRVAAARQQLSRMQPDR
jgi:tetratricopeptide (TPR) repeat protein